VIVDRCLGVRRDEIVVIVGDRGTREVAAALWDASCARTSNAVLVTMDEHLDGEPPAPVAAALATADVFLVPMTGSLSHTQARKAASERGARGATLPGVTAQMLARTMLVDFDAMRARSEAVAQLLSEADHAHLTCSRGTDLMLDLSGRGGLVDDADLTAKHAFGNLPAGEGAISPRSGEGRVAVMSITPVGILPEPMLLTVKGGQVVAGEGPYSAEFLELLRTHGSGATNLAELGVGTNDAAILTGNVLEDEKVAGTAHVAFGASDTIGGNVRASIHRDVMVFDATLTIGDTPVLDGGRWLLDGASVASGKDAAA
jgi:leucyl aminopeptidase (aminopeptidase T)